MRPKNMSQTKRFARIVRMLKRMRPLEVPVTHRHNLVELLPEGGVFFAALQDALRSARHTILLEYYIIRADRTGAAFAAELAAAVQRGVTVRLIYDYIGCLDTPSSYFKQLAQQGVQLVPFNVPSFKRGVYWFDKRDHRKMAIIDGYRAFLGGFNIGDAYSGLAHNRLRFRDLGFSIQGEAVGELVAIFNDAWLSEWEDFHQLPPVCPLLDCPAESGEALVNIVSGGPRQRRSYIREAFQVNIASAATEILIATPYFVPGVRIVRALLRAVRRGVRVQLLLPARSDVPLVLLLGRSSYAALLRGGVEIFELEREILHAKVMLIDGERTVIGSANLDQRSFHRNFEINCIVDNAPFGGQIRELLMNEFALAHQVALDVHERRGLLVRLMERVVNLFGWFL